MSNTQFRIHPAIGIARVGNSDDYYLGPETMAGMPTDNDNGITGGLPIVPDTDDTTITSAELRDNDGKLKKQAARFKIYLYDDAPSSYPSGAGSEVRVGDSITVNGETKVVEDIIWSLHLANKKANSWIEQAEGIAGYTPTNDCPDRSPAVRNPDFDVADSSLKENWGCSDEICCDATKVLGDTNRLEKLVIDSGPQAIQNGRKASFSRGATNTYFDSTSNTITNVKYPQQYPSYPGDVAKDVRIDSLGAMQTDKNGHLIVLPGDGKATGFTNSGDYEENVILKEDVNNDNYYDDTADGPVTATIAFKDGSFAEVEGNSWVITTDPSYAPQIRNVVTLWDDLYNTWVEKFNLEDSIYDVSKWPNADNSSGFNCGTGYNPAYKPDFDQQVKPILEAAELQRWAVNLKSAGVNAHQVISESTVDNPTRTDLLDFIRNPNDENPNDTPQNSTRMPLSLGDSEQDFLAVSRTQFFFLNQWMNGNASSGERDLGPGEKLDRNILGNCLGGRFSPGIEMTFIVRDPNLYQGWNGSSGSVPNVGPFRINMQPMDYSSVNVNEPYLGIGYMPDRTNSPVEPGDICKFMSIPWHTDYNSCATHETSPNVDKSNMTYWSWPAQRPVAVYTYEDLACYGDLEFQRFSVRGDGTESSNAASSDPSAHVGRFQDRNKILSEWDNIGFVIQAPAIANTDIDTASLPAADVMKNYYLEVESNFKTDQSNLVVESPIPANSYTAPPHGGCPHAAAAMKKKSE